MPRSPAPDRGLTVANKVEMVIVDGVRYHPDDVPARKEVKAEPTKEPERKQRTVSNKARSTAEVDNK